MDDDGKEDERPDPVQADHGRREIPDAPVRPRDQAIHQNNRAPAQPRHRRAIPLLDNEPGNLLHLCELYHLAAVNRYERRFSRDSLQPP